MEGMGRLVGPKTEFIVKLLRDLQGGPVGYALQHLKEVLNQERFESPRAIVNFPLTRLSMFLIGAGTMAVGKRRVLILNRLGASVTSTGSLRPAVSGTCQVFTKVSKDSTPPPNNV